MSNFSFLPPSFRDIDDTARRAESHIHGDPRAACFHARFTLEAIVHWLYRHDPALTMPYDNNLGALLHATSFQNLLPQIVFQKARLIQKVGNQAVHDRKPIRQYDALQVVKELHHVCHWLTRTYVPDAGPAPPWDDTLIPKPAKTGDVVPRAELERLEQQLAQQNQKDLERQQEQDELNTELQVLRDQLAKIREQSQKKRDSHDYSEAETRKYLIDVDLKRAGWPLDQKRDLEYEVTGMPNNKGLGFADYVLWGDDGKPLGVVEAKKTTVDPQRGQQQAKLYADCLEKMHGQRPIIFYTNGYKTWVWDDQLYPPRQCVGFYKKDELERLIRRRDQQKPLDVGEINDEIAGRYYQKRAIGSICKQFTEARRKALLVMATGTGKTRTAIALVDLLQRAGWVKRALFLADRVSLVNQACNAFKANLPSSSPVNLVTEKDTQGRVYVCTYPTMMGLIDQTKGGEARFGVGHFDLVIIDEAHRSVYKKYGAIFDYFDSLLVGLTATPREEVDKNTYDLFDLQPGVPTDAYELEQAVQDGFLVPPKVQQVDLKFPRQGIDYDQLSEEEKEQWESLDWGDDLPPNTVPSQVNASAINNWLFNRSTVDLVLEHLMLHGHKVEGGDRLAKTIIFARNHDHAKFIEERFNHHYPQHKGHFARIIDVKAKYPQSLIDDFSQKDKDPHIAISVDMLDTGIDIPEVANLVFFKPVYSKIKFWQMIGRGTRLCPDLFGPGDDKQDFRVFDFCFNFDFFKENPEGLKGSDGASLGARIFQARVQLLSHIQAHSDLDPESTVGTALRNTLHAEVAAMNTENFIVRMQLEHVEPFQKREKWDHLSDGDRGTLEHKVAGLPSELETDELEARLFDYLSLKMQVALAEADHGTFESNRQKVLAIASLLEGMKSVPAVAEQLDYLASMQGDEFWQGMSLADLEDMRLRLRSLVRLIEKQKRKIVYTDFKDEVLGVREEAAVNIPKMTGAQYEKKVRDYLREHQNHIAVHRLYTNEPLTETDLQGLEATLAEIGEEDGKTLLDGLLKRSGTPSLAHFVRSLVGLDRQAAQAAFSEFLNDRSLTPAQMRFIELIIDQLTSRGVMEASALYEAPFTDLHAGGPDALFEDKHAVINAVFERLQSLEPRVEGMAG
ncbi:MAG: DEAD/DEAH box helicase family protein [Phycisphaeraceae bacterium]